jgi:hypothetical protein
MVHPEASVGRADRLWVLFPSSEDGSAPAGGPVAGVSADPGPPLGLVGQILTAQFDQSRSQPSAPNAHLTYRN